MEQLKAAREELKPCPFCGGTALERGDPNARLARWVNCKDCNADMVGKTLDDAIAKWNRRSLPEARSGAVSAAAREVITLARKDAERIRAGATSMAPVRNVADNLDLLADLAERALSLPETRPGDAGLRELYDEAVTVLEEITSALRIHAPGTPLNNHRFDSLGIKANNVIAKHNSIAQSAALSVPVGRALSPSPGGRK